MRLLAILMSVMAMSTPSTGQVALSDDGRGTNLPEEVPTTELAGPAGQASWARVAELVARGEAGQAPAWLVERYWRVHRRDDRSEESDACVVRVRYSRLWPVGPLSWGLRWRTLWDPWWGLPSYGPPPIRSHRGDPWVPYRF